MSHLALYREFRPDSFDKIIGQEHVVQTLINQINTGKIGHAYLFTGARGTGKTTAAKVFARAINCLNPKNGNPCGECEVCKMLKSPENLDIVEMDAASNNGVDNIRDIREKVQYPPVAGRYKVYIIDEAHMLSPGAFNAFLKTLEEPPSHAVFILATTEVHKIPATILSRCMRFDFKLIKTSEIASLICKIYDKIGKKYEKEAVNLIAKSGEGSVRDALSIADICVSYSEGILTYNDVLEVLGASDRNKTEELVKKMFDSDIGGMLSAVDDLCSLGKSVNVLNKDVCGVLRDLLVVKTCKNAGVILGMPDDRLKDLADIAKNVVTESILRAIEIFSTCEADLKYSTSPKIIFETAAVKASLPAADYSIDALMARVAKLEKKIESGDIKVSLANKDSENKSESQSIVVGKSVEKAIEKLNEKLIEYKADSVAENIVDKKVENEVGENVGKVEKSAYKSINEDFNIEEAGKLVETKTLNEKEIVRDEISENETESVVMPEMDEDLASLINEGEKSGFGDYIQEEGGFFMEQPKSAYKSINATSDIKEDDQKVDKKTLKAEKNIIMPKSDNEQLGGLGITGHGDGTIIWGSMLKKLRQDKEIMLWVACQDVTATFSDGNIVVIASGENEYNLLSKPQNLEKLNACAKANGVNRIEIMREGEHQMSIGGGKQKDFDGVGEEEKENKVKDFLKGENLEITD